VTVGLGALGLATAIFVLVRLSESWRVTTHGSSHHVSILGQTISYPAANADALVILALAAVGAVVLTRTLFGALREARASARFVRELRQRDPAQLADALVVDDGRPWALCAGLVRPRIYISSAAVAALDPKALRAVLAHERHHARRRDPLRLAGGRVVARALGFLPGLEALVEDQRSLAELGADEGAAAGAAVTRSDLARALLSLADDGRLDPARVDHLLGEPPSWRLPMALCVGAVALLALLVAVAWLAGRLASGSATLAPPLLSAQPCVVALAAIPAAVGALVWSRREPDQDAAPGGAGAVEKRGG
jgi:hypothetical protein